MSKYLNPDLVCLSFKRLASRERTGKIHKERTSALMIFLAFDATCKFFHVNELDLNPNSNDGKLQRDHIALEYNKLVLLDNSFGNLKHVVELGKIDIGGRNPDSRFSSNFLTVPLKKASEQKEPYAYPRRPSMPVLQLGAITPSMIWGITYHDDWASSFQGLLSNVRDSTPLLDLAIFVCRDCKINENATELIPSLADQLGTRFTKDVAEFWIFCIKKEKILARHTDMLFVNHHTRFANSCADSLTQSNKYHNMNKSDLIERILALEAILDNNDIEY